MKASRAPLPAVPGGVSTAWYHQTGKMEGTSAGPASAGVMTYRGIRGVKHRNERLHQRSATTVTDDVSESCRPPVSHYIVTPVTKSPFGGSTAQTTQPRQSVAVRQTQSSADQPRPVNTSSSSSARRPVSADRQRVTASTQRTFFETLYHDKVGARLHTQFTPAC